MLENTSIVARLMQIREEIDALIVSAAHDSIRDNGMYAITHRVSTQTGVPFSQIVGRQQRKDIVEARHLAMRLIHETGRYSYPQIGRFFHRDHSTVMAAIRKSAG